MLRLAMLVGFIVAVFWVIATVVFIRGFKHWAHGHEQIKQNEAEEDLIDEVLGR
jgi:type III secretory pathway component EscV